MSEIKRYDCEQIAGGTMMERENGCYVSYHDHESALAQARAEERERCAVEAWSFGMMEYKGVLQDPREVGSLIARRIRALSDKQEDRREP